MFENIVGPERPLICLGNIRNHTSSTKSTQLTQYLSKSDDPLINIFQTRISWRFLMTLFCQKSVIVMTPLGWRLLHSISCNLNKTTILWLSQWSLGGDGLFIIKKWLQCTIKCSEKYSPFLNQIWLGWMELCWYIWRWDNKYALLGAQILKKFQSDFECKLRY